MMNFPFHHVERVGRALDDVGSVLQERPDAAERRDLGAGGEKLEELAPRYLFGHTGP